MFAGTSSRRLAPGALLLLCGCALIVDGTSQEVRFESDPPGATFTVGGRTATTPDTLDISKEDYVIVFSKPGYRPQEFQLKRQTSGWFYGSLAMGVVASAVDILTGAWQEFQTDQVRVILEPLLETKIEERDVAFDSSPAGAEVLIGEVVQGRTPLTLKLGWRTLEEQKEVSFRLAAYHPRTLPLKRAEARLSAALVPMPVIVKVHLVSVPPGADVRVEGRGVGRSPVYADVTWLPGQPPKSVEFSLAGYRTEKKSLSGPEARKAEAELPEVFEDVPLPVTVFPPGAQIEVDGASAALSGGALGLRWSVSLQRHTVRVSHPGYRPQTKDVVSGERAAPLEFRLQPSLPKQP